MYSIVNTLAVVVLIPSRAKLPAVNFLFFPIPSLFLLNFFLLLFLIKYRQSSSYKKHLKAATKKETCCINQLPSLTLDWIMIKTNQPSRWWVPELNIIQVQFGSWVQFLHSNKKWAEGKDARVDWAREVKFAKPLSLKNWKHFDFLNFKSPWCQRLWKEERTATWLTLHRLRRGGPKKRINSAWEVTRK